MNKDYAFCGFLLSISILGMPTFREPCSPPHQSEEQPDTKLFLRVVPFYITLLVGMMMKGGRRELWVRRGRKAGEISQFSITGRMIFYILYIL